MRRGAIAATAAGLALLLGAAGIAERASRRREMPASEPPASARDEDSKEAQRATPRAKPLEPALREPPRVADGATAPVASGRTREPAQRALDGAEDALAQNDLPRARVQARECLGLDPALLECHHALVYSFTRGGEYGAELAQVIDDCLAVRPRDPYCLEAKILALLTANDLDGARVTLAVRDAMLDQPPDYVGEAELALASHDTTAACEAFRGACRLSQPYACERVAKLCSATP